MKLVLICRDALANALIGNLIFATEAKRSGEDVSIIFTEEALAALCRGVFLWPKGLQEQEVRWKVADRAKAQGMPVMGRGEGRQIDAKAFLQRAREAGVRLLACPIWTDLLGVQEELPDGVEIIDTPGMVKAIQEADNVIGAY